MLEKAGVKSDAPSAQSKKSGKLAGSSVINEADNGLVQIPGTEIGFEDKRLTAIMKNRASDGNAVSRGAFSDQQAVPLETRKIESAVLKLDSKGASVKVADLASSTSVSSSSSIDKDTATITKRRSSEAYIRSCVAIPEQPAVASASLNDVVKAPVEHSSSASKQIAVVTKTAATNGVTILPSGATRKVPTTDSNLSKTTEMIEHAITNSTKTSPRVLPNPPIQAAELHAPYGDSPRSAKVARSRSSSTAFASQKSKSTVHESENQKASVVIDEPIVFNSSANKSNELLDYNITKSTTGLETTKPVKPNDTGAAEKDKQIETKIVESAESAVGSSRTAAKFKRTENAGAEVKPAEKEALANRPPVPPTAVVNQSPTAVVNQSPTTVVNQSPTTVVVQSPTAVVNQSPTKVVNQSPTTVVNQSPTIVKPSKKSPVKSIVNEAGSQDTLKLAKLQALPTEPPNPSPSSRNQILTVQGGDDSSNKYMCNNCEKPAAVIRCEECFENLCIDCDTVIHINSKRKQHIRQPLLQNAKPLQKVIFSKWHTT